MSFDFTLLKILEHILLSVPSGTLDHHEWSHMLVSKTDQELSGIRSSLRSKNVREWKLDDFPELEEKWTDATTEDHAIKSGREAFLKVQCHQCHATSGQGINLGPDLTESIKKYQGIKLLQQILEPSSEIHPQYCMHQFLLHSGQLVSGTIAKENDQSIEVVTNLLEPKKLITLAKSEIEDRQESKVSPMPRGLVNRLTKQEILDLIAYLESGLK